MAKRQTTDGKPSRPRRSGKFTNRARGSRREDVVEPEDIEMVAEDDLESEDSDFDVEEDIEIEDDEDDTRRGDARVRAKFDKAQAKFDQMNKLFGEDGPFGRAGPFGSDGPFGPQGFFGPGGVFGGNATRRGGGRRNGPARFTDRPQKRKRMFGSGELRLVLLAMLAEEARHGYELIKALEEMTDGAYSPSPGIVYPTLQMLNDEGVIAVQDSDDARKLYQATQAGIAELEDRADEVAELWERLGRRAERARPQDSPDLFRALGNLASVLTKKASKGSMNKINQEQIVDLIDELARKIERL